jgi:hypothetical protein
MSMQPLAKVGTFESVHGCGHRVEANGIKVLDGLALVASLLGNFIGFHAAK